jgi:cell division protein FtsB
MARVVQHRSKPPVLLIVFIILFVIAAVAAVVGFVQRDELQIKLDENTQQTTDLNGQIDKLKQGQEVLIRTITGLKVQPDVAVKEAKDLVNNPDYVKVGGQESGLAPEAKLLVNRILDKEKAILALQDTIASLQKQLAGKDDDLKKLQDDTKSSLDKIEAKFAELNTTYGKDHADFAGKAEEFAKNLEETRTSLRDEAKKYEQKIEKLTLDNHGLKREIAKLNSQIDDLQVRIHGGKGDINRKADGLVDKVVPSTGLCYINIGSEDNIQNGMTFAVYGPNDENNASPKGKLRAISVSPTFAECQIVETADGKVLEEKDVITNLVYDPNRKYVFVVKGAFDLYGDGRATQEQTDEVVQAIKLHGGEIGKDVNVQTDYVVMGTEPTKPIKPADDAPDAVQLAYKKQMETYDDYAKTKKAAEALKIPVLNTNRFLELTGYMPEKRPQD